jgi:hypothetical protein
MNNLNKFHKWVTAVSVYISLDSYRRALNAEKANEAVTRNHVMIEDAKKILGENVTASTEAFNNLQQSNIKATAQYDKCNTALEHLMSVRNRLKSTATTGDSNLIKVNQEALLDAVKNVQTESDKLRQIILLRVEAISNSGKGSGSGGSMNNFIGSYFDFLNNFLSNLTLLQKGAVAHIIASIFIIFCLFSILSAVFGDFLITYFKLEEKWPKLAKWVQLRIKLQYTYIVANAIFILLTLGYIIYVNILVFLI